MTTWFSSVTTGNSAADASRTESGTRSHPSLAAITGPFWLETSARVTVPSAAAMVSARSPMPMTCAEIASSLVTGVSIWISVTADHHPDGVWEQFGQHRVVVHRHDDGLEPGLRESRDHVICSRTGLVVNA